MWSQAAGDFELKAPRRKDEMPSVLAAVGPSGLWCGLGSGTIAIYDVEQWSAPPNNLVGAHSAEVTAICSAFGGFAAVSGSADFSVKSWDLKGRCLSVLSAHHAPVKALAACGAESVWTGAADGTVFVARDADSEGKLSADEGQVLKLPSGGAASGIRCLRNLGGKIWAGTDDGRVAVWDGATLEFEGEAQFHSDAVTSIQDMGSDVWTGGADKKILCWDARQRPPMMKYSIGTQDGYIKAMVRQGWSLWSFTSKGSKVFASAGLSDEAERNAAGLEAKIEELTAQLSQQLKVTDDLVQGAREQEDTLEGLRQAVEAREADLGMVRGERDSLGEECAALREAETTGRAALEAAQAKAGAAAGDLRAREEELETARAQATQERSDLEQQLEAAVVNTQEARMELAKVQAALQGSRNECEVQEGRAAEGAEAAASLRAELQALKALREREGQEDDARIAELEAQAREAQAGHLQEIDALRETLLREKSEQRDMAQELVAAVKAERDEILRESHERAKRVEEEKGILRTEIDSLVERQTAAAEAAVKAHAQEREELVARGQQQVQELRLAMEAATAERATAAEAMRAELMAAQAEARTVREGAEAAARQHAEEIAEARARAEAQVKDARSALEEQTVALEAQKASLAAELGARAAGLEADLSEARSSAGERARAHAAELAAREAAAEEAATVARKEKRSLEVALQMSKAAAHELGGATRDLEAQLEVLETEAEERLQAAEAGLAE